LPLRIQLLRVFRAEHTGSALDKFGWVAT